jgi:hypothetical protein
MYFKKMFIVELEELTTNLPEGMAETHENPQDSRNSNHMKTKLMSL